MTGNLLRATYTLRCAHRTWLIAFALPLFLFPSPARSAWNATKGLAVCTAVNDQTNPMLVTDANGGAIATWFDYRNGQSEIFAQRISANGDLLWTPVGVRIAPSTFDWTMVADESGGAFIVWPGNSGYDLYAQHVSPTGQLLWGAGVNDGVVVCSAPGWQRYPTAIFDPSGDVVIAWHDQRTSDYAIYAQRLSPAGVAKWATDGVVVSATVNREQYPSIATDGAGGWIVAYDRTYKVYAQRLNGNGTTLWAAGGSAIATGTTYSDSPPRLSPDGAGGAIILWDDKRNGFWNIYAQHVNSTGAVQWQTDGIKVNCCPFYGDPDCALRPQLTDDGAGGVIAAWTDCTDNLYAQRIPFAGGLAWPGAPINVGTAIWVSIASDGEGGAFVAWDETRSGNSDPYAQQLDSQGTQLWATGGILLTTAGGTQYAPVVVRSGDGGIVAWSDHRNGNYDIYGQHIGPLPTSVGGSRVPGPFVVDLHPNPFSSQTEISVHLSHEATVEITIFDAAGRRVRVFDALHRPAGTSRLSFDGMDSSAQRLASGVYFCRVNAGGESVTRKLVIAR
ncbi:MAG TPA: T9SS type A sorting domain-containing protein [Candidatus Krumholzibacteria bacterium]|nr:T9SS type A sorting domain-containing protein [Candidatus Krumholzibacteria bacterium]